MAAPYNSELMQEYLGNQKAISETQLERMQLQNNIGNMSSVSSQSGSTASTSTGTQTNITGKTTNSGTTNITQLTRQMVTSVAISPSYNQEYRDMAERARLLAADTSSKLRDLKERTKQLERDSNHFSTLQTNTQGVAEQRSRDALQKQFTLLKRELVIVSRKLLEIKKVFNLLNTGQINPANIF